MYQIFIFSITFFYNIKKVYRSLTLMALILAFIISFETHVCSPYIFQECCRWLNENQVTPTLNTTNIALIPKRQQQRPMKDFVIYCINWYL